MLALLLSVLAVSENAQALRYKPKQDETLDHIARIHYGKSKKKIYIIPTNRISDPAKIQKRKSLWIPTVWKYRVKRGDGLSKIAKKFLKNTQRADFLMWLNHIDNPKNIKAGTLITMPFIIRHRVQEGQNMVDLAKRYYFRSKPAGLLRKFNAKRTNALKPGEIILVPIYDPEAATEKVRQRLKHFKEVEAKAAEEAIKRAKRMAEERAKERLEKKNRDHAIASTIGGPDPLPLPATNMDSASLLEKNKPGLPKTSSPKDKSLVQQAYKLFRDGEYELARANLSRVLESGNLAKPDEAEAREILAYCLVALGKVKEAEHEFVRLLMVSPDRTLDPVTTSPKVMEVFNKAKGNK